MAKLKTLRKFLPELAQMAIVIVYWCLTYFVNPVAWVLILLLTLQIIFQKKTMGIIISSIFAFLSVWMLFAFLSDMAKITEYTEKTKTFLLYGSLFCTSLLLASGAMLGKYTRKLNTDEKRSHEDPDFQNVL
jgi:hypothetical protein